MRLSSGDQLGPYRVGAPLGAGGMGEVYRARDVRLGRDVALKILPAAVAADPRLLRRLRSEAAALAQLAHPNVVTLFDAGEIDGITYVASELVEGETLRMRLMHGPLPEYAVYDCGAQLARGLAAAHARGIVHGDVTSANVMLTADGRVKLLDFGLARRTVAVSAETETLDTGDPAGTSGYMAPEQVRGETTDARTDVFALGVLLYEMSSGRRPFVGATAADVQAAVLRDEPLQRIVARCLRKAPAERYPSAGDVALLLEAAEAWRDAPPRDPGAGRRARPLRWLAMAAGLAALAAGASWSAPTWSAPAVLDPNPERLTFRRGTVFDARFVPLRAGAGIVYSAAWDGLSPDVFEVLGDREARPRGWPDTVLLAAARTGDLAVARQAQFPSFGQVLGLLSVAPPGGEVRDLGGLVTAADFATDRSTTIALARPDPEGGWRLEWPQGQVVYRGRQAILGVRVADNGDLAWIEAGPNGGVMLLPRGGTPRLLVGQTISPGGLAWSPDGTEIWHTAPRSQTLDDTEIRAVTRDGRVRTLLRQAGGVRLLDVAADGRLLVSVARTSIELMVKDAIGQRNVGWLGSSFLRELSDDGQWALFSEDGPSGFDIYLRKTDGSPAVRVAEGLTVPSVKLAPDRSRVAYPDRGALRIVPIGAGAPITVPMPVRPAAWLPDSRRLVAWAATAHGGHPVVVDSAAPTAPPQVVADMTCDFDPVLSPSGRRLACRDAGTLAVHELGGPTTRVPLAGGAVTLVGWSADERTLFGFTPGRVPQFVRRIDAATGVVRDGVRLDAPDPVGVWRVHPLRVTPDERTLAYSVTRRLDEIYLYRLAE
jgi:hypothetical protein